MKGQRHERIEGWEDQGAGVVRVEGEALALADQNSSSGLKGGQTMGR